MDKNIRKVLKLEDEGYLFSEDWITEETVNNTVYYVIHGIWEGSIDIIIKEK